MPVGHQFAATQHIFHQAAGWALVQLAIVQKAAFGLHLGADGGHLCGQGFQFFHVVGVWHWLSVVVSLVVSLVFSWCLQGSNSGFWGSDRYIWASF